MFGRWADEMDATSKKKISNRIAGSLQTSYIDLGNKNFRMEFGRVPENELNKIDYKLSPDPVFNKKILKGEAVKKPKVYVGCAKWGRVEWVGKIYPPKTKEKDFLEHYVQHYNS